MRMNLEYQRTYDLCPKSELLINLNIILNTPTWHHSQAVSRRPQLYKLSKKRKKVKGHGRGSLDYPDVAAVCIQCAMTPVKYIQLSLLQTVTIASLSCRHVMVSGYFVN